MSFRWRLLTGLVLVVLLTAGIYGLAGYAVFRVSQDRWAEAALAAFRQAVLGALDLSGERPSFTPSQDARTVLQTYADSGFSLWRGSELLLTGYRPLPETFSEGWHVEELALGDGYTLQLGLNVSDNARVLATYGRAALLALALALALAVLFGWALHHLLLRPLRALQHGVEQLSAEAFPPPVEIPPGDDELSKLALGFNRMNAALKTFVERERSFTRYASHELRTPLANLKVLSEGLRKGYLSPEETWPQIDASLTRMEGILTGLLNLTRSPDLKPEPLPLEPIARRAAESFSREERERVQLIVQATPCVLGDEELLTRVLANLLGNALKYSAGEVYLRVRTRGDNAVVSVRDFGPGVPEAALEKLSEPFYRLDTRRAGLGLGLALARHIAGAMRGWLEFRVADPGLEVNLVLPALHLPETNEPSLGSRRVNVNA
jgi:signal transduction histidine kinase